MFIKQKKLSTIMFAGKDCVIVNYMIGLCNVNASLFIKQRKLQVTI